MEVPKFIAPGEKILKHPNLISDVLERKSRIPIHFEMDLTNRCNLACEGCHFAYIHGSPHDTSLDMPIQLSQKIVTDMADSGVKAITFTGGGEPTFHPKHLEIFQMTKEVGLRMGMYTNGVLLRNQTADFVANNFDWVYVSLDATNAKEYEEYKNRGEVTFNMNIDNVRALTARRDRQATVGVGYLVGPHNLDGLFSAIPWLMGLGADYIQFRPMIDVGSYDEQREAGAMKGLAISPHTQKEWQEHYSWIPRAREILDRFDGVPGLDTSKKKFIDLYSGRRAYTTCLSTSLVGCIGAMGEAWLCVNTRALKPLGDLKIQTLSEIYSDKPIAVEDLTKCRLMCRNDQLNQTLSRIDSGLRHIEFI